MEESKGISERDTSGVKPLALSRQTISIIVVIAIVLWCSAFFLWRQVELEKWLLISHNGLRTNELVVSVAQAYQVRDVDHRTGLFALFVVCVQVRKAA